MQQSFKNEKNTLFLIPTPIGNLGEISPRVIETIKDCDVIACEDTRVTGKLLSHLEIKKRMVVFADHNSKQSIAGILKLLETGNVGLVSDAGMPLISDPGIDLVREIQKDYNVVSISGPSAFVNALVVSGLDTSRFTFIGFLPNKETQRLKELEALKDNKETLIFYESSHRINKSLGNMFDVFSKRKICVARELTKKHEEIHRVSLPYEVEMPKGEFVVIVEGNNIQEEINIGNLITKLRDNGLSNKEIIKEITSTTHFKKNEIYDLVSKK